MNEVQYERNQELAAQGQHANACLDAILSANGSDMTLRALYRSIYKYTDCGPWLSVKTWDGRVFHCQDLHKVNENEVRYLLLGSIVEGSDAEVTADWIDLCECESPEDAVKAFEATLAWVNDAACALWDEANGEPETPTLADDAPELLAALAWALDQLEDSLDPDHQQALEAAQALVARHQEA